jgi:hypothetical protein
VIIEGMSLAGPATAVVVVRGDKQRGRAGAELAKMLVLAVRDANGNGVPNTELLLSPSGGAVPDSAPRTDSLGIVRTTWTLGREARSYSLAVHVAGVNALTKLYATAIPGPPANLSFDDAPSQAKKAATKHLNAIVTDVFGNPVADARVSFATKSGIVRPGRAVSDARGRAALVWTLGTKPGEQTLTGIVSGQDVTGVFVAQRVEHVSAASKSMTAVRHRK